MKILDPPEDKSYPTQVQWMYGCPFQVIKPLIGLNLAGLALGCGMGLETKAIYSIANEHEKHAFRFVFNAILNSQATGTATDAAAATVVTRCATSTRQCPGSRPSTRSNAQNPIFKFHMRKPLRNVASNAVRTLFGQAIPI